MLMFVSLFFSDVCCKTASRPVKSSSLLWSYPSLAAHGGLSGSAGHLIYSFRRFFVFSREGLRSVMPVGLILINKRLLQNEKPPKHSRAETHRRRSPKKLEGGLAGQKVRRHSGVETKPAISLDWELASAPTAFLTPSLHRSGIQSTVVCQILRAGF